jgi:adenine-specific DNA-methyltransferase
MPIPFTSRGNARPMATGMDRWNATDAFEWGRVLGLVPIPLFGRDEVANVSRASVLLDGQRSSFTFLGTPNSSDLLGDKPLEWSWSAFLNHTVIADSAKGQLLLRRWDSPETIRRFRLPTTPRAASQFFDVIRDDKPSTHADVILHLLRAFRAIRETVRDGDNGLESIRMFNTLILASKAVADGVIEPGAVADRETIGDVLEQLERLPNAHQFLFEASGAADLLASTKGIAASILVSRFLDDEPQFRYALEPNLLMRHASGQLYQEAHLALDRPVSQPSLFPGIDEASTAARPPARSDVRFTPVALARTLVQQALKAYKDLLSRPKLDILDPACGSAVFLIQLVQELATRGYRGQVVIRGFDLSPISCVMARFCLEHCRQDARAGGMDITCQIEVADALERDWGAPDIVLMNPPFIHLDKMSDSERAVVNQVLGDLVKGRVDKAMAFAWKAFQSIARGGVVATVLPAPLLETKTGEAWRQALADQAEFTLLGCFRGFGYFKGAKIEPAFLVIRKPEVPPPAPLPITVVVASDGAEDDALRMLRQDLETVMQDKGRFEVSQAPRATVVSQPSWAPRSKAYRAGMERLKSLSLPTVADLFDVKQGAKTGLNRALIITASIYEGYGARAKTYFRPVAATSTIRNGKLALLGFLWVNSTVSGACR